MDMYRVLVTGDRNWEDYPTMLGVLSKIDDEAKSQNKKVMLIHGNAKGADAMADGIGNTLGWNVVAVPANWAEYGKNAGPFRNREMLSMRPNIVIGFHKMLWTSEGTLDCLKQATRLGLKVELHQ